MSHSHRIAWCAALVATLLMPHSAAAQIRASEIGTMTQVIDGTKLSITYSRPRMRGRQPLFGTRAAHWGEVWTPGANWATVPEVSKDITLNGRAVPKGKYSVWMVLREAGDWTTVLEPKWHLYHMEPPDSNATQVRITTPVSLAPFVDVLTWSMPELTVSGGTLAMQWGTTRLTFAMIRVGPDIFTPGLYDKDGSIYEVLRPDMMFTFRSVAGQPVTFSVRSFDDSLEATGTKKP